MSHPRWLRLREEMNREGIELLALVPGANLFYVTGLSFHRMERPIVALFPLDGDPVLILPAFEIEKARQAPIPWRLFPYTDEEGPARAFQAAAAAVGQRGRPIAVETLGMRVLEWSMLAHVFSSPEPIAAEPLLARLRMVKDPDEIAAIRRAVAVAEEALRIWLPHVQRGMTEREATRRLIQACFAAGADALAFEPIVVAGPNTALPHAIPTDRPIGTGELLLVDFGVIVEGYVSDLTRTFAVDELDPELRWIYERVQEANAAGRAAVRPGIPAEAVDRAARSVIEAAGYGAHFTHRTGHGLGLEVHEPPYIVAGNTELLQPGMTFTIEPGIYLPGKGGVRIEDDVVVTESGAESLTTFPRELMCLGG
ncbi:Xaa-Pro peptidase family protein [Thermoflexus sp.]|uniref:M24 family metallopeptidase n=1 Tax=Thermoflexus sp. TaxID=1969742 RepID=UPI001758DC92|nr:Xaa-Pro peptidase family protein [Thermoflexus sp.]